MARRNKVYDPGKAAEDKAERARLVASGATVNLDRAGKVVSAYRSNVFRLLLERGTITQDHHDAAYSLANAWAAWKGLDGKGDTLGEAVDGGSGCKELITDRMIRGGKDVARALTAVDPLSRLILEAFMVAVVEEDRPMAWRGIVERVGITVRDRQTEVVVASVEALRAHYQEPRREAA